MEPINIKNDTNLYMHITKLCPDIEERSWLWKYYKSEEKQKFYRIISIWKLPEPLPCRVINNRCWGRPIAGCDSTSLTLAHNRRNLFAEIASVKNTLTRFS